MGASASGAWVLGDAPQDLRGAPQVAGDGPQEPEDGPQEEGGGPQEAGGGSQGLVGGPRALLLTLQTQGSDGSLMLLDSRCPTTLSR